MGAPVVASRAARGRRVRHKPMSDINVTPFVDVMLVLLIVFMVAAPLMAVTVPVELAKSAATPEPDAAPLTVSVTSAGSVFVGDTPVSKDDVVTTIRTLSHGSTDQRIYLSGAKDVTYQQVVEIMGLIDAAGYTHIGLMGASAN
jgi:biopolymer transport protein TolR